MNAERRHGRAASARGDSVAVSEDATTEGKLEIELEYRVRRTNQTGNLVFPFYLIPDEGVA